jgi:dethiobiotin synthetase
MESAAPRSCFVVGTDIGVGKTLIASALVHLLCARGVRTVGMKPVAAGARWRDGRWSNEGVERLAEVGSFALPSHVLCPYLLEPPVAPHIAAELSGVTLKLEPMVQTYEALATWADVVIVEGVGGFRVPLAAGFDSADLAIELGLPLLLVVGLRPGCLNHALLTAEALASRGLKLLGWVANQIDRDMRMADRHVDALRQRLAAPCVGSVPWLATPIPATAGRWLKPDELMVGLTA